MKALTLLALALTGVSCMVAAEQRPANAENQDLQNVEHYSYSMDLDIARVIQPAEIPDICGPAPVQMVYEDHQGQRHTLEYLVMGSGCSNG
ncbi:hypothetical protein D3C81_1506720 [compost metagenome]